MVETIAPVVHGGRNRNYWTAVALHTVGATLSAAALGAVLGGIGALLGAPWGTMGWLSLASIAALYAIRELFEVHIPLPDLDRQVPDWWRTYFSRNVAALLYGLGLGVGFLTYLSFGTLVAVAVAALVIGEPLLGAFSLGTFGSARGISVIASVSRDPVDVVETLGAPALRRKARLLNGVTLATIALLVVTAGLISS